MCFTVLKWGSSLFKLKLKVHDMIVHNFNWDKICTLEVFVGRVYFSFQHPNLQSLTVCPCISLGIQQNVEPSDDL